MGRKPKLQSIWADIVTLPKQIKQQASLKKKAASKFQMHAPKEKRGIYKNRTKRTFQIIFSVSGHDIINCI
jgi:hypothetical protein